MVDREPPIGKGSWSQDKIPSKQQVRVKEGEDLDNEGPGTEEPLEENPHQREGSRAPSRLEGKTHHPPGPLGSPEGRMRGKAGQRPIQGAATED